MSAQLLPEVLVLSCNSPQRELPLAAEGVLSYVWQHRFGEMLVEVKDGQAFVDGKVVEPVSSAGAQAGRSLDPSDLEGR